MIKQLFTDHPATVGESYFEHMAQALSFAVIMLRGGLALVVHAMVPGCFVRTGSLTILTLHSKMITNRKRIPGAGSNSFDYVI